VLLEICDSRIHDKSYMISLSLNQVVRKQIEAATSWMTPKTPLKIRCLAIQMGFTESTFPPCKNCRKAPVTYRKEYLDGFSDYCSAHCSREHQHRLPESTYNRLSNREWLYQQRITLKKSFEEIAIELGCSVTPVKKACRSLKIPNVRHNESNSLIMAKLKDREYLHQSHIIEKKKVSDIAMEIGSSAATVSRWLSDHGIATNNPNIYDRKVNKISGEQTEVYEFLKSLLPNDTIIIGNRSILGMEIDITIPSRNLMIEYNGIYSHLHRPQETTPSRQKGKRYHLNKTLAAKKAGFRLVHIFSDDWVLRKSIWKSILSNIVGMAVDKHPARKLEIRDVRPTEKKIFLNENHLQGNDRSRINYGLWNGDELIAAMTFCPSRYNKSFQWELSRFCVRMGVSCPGGFSRLLKHFRKNHSTSIISYADFSRSNGDVYEKNGFRMLRHNPPSYAYVNLKLGIQRHHRSNFTKKKLGITDDTTETDHMTSLGYSRIFDCGTIAYVID
jgi:hypothetical protein